jgi:hypothetical protein
MLIFGAILVSEVAILATSDEFGILYGIAIGVYAIAALGLFLWERPRRQ